MIVLLAMLLTVTALADSPSEKYFAVLSPDHQVVVTEADLTCARLKLDGLKRQTLEVRLNEAAQTRLFEMTGKNIGKPVETRICRKSHGTPVIRAAIRGEVLHVPQIAPAEAKCLTRGFATKVLKKCPKDEDTTLRQ